MELEAVSLLPPETPATTFATIVAEGKATPAGTPPPKEKEAEVTPTPVATELPVTASVAMDTGEMAAGTTAREFPYAKDVEGDDEDGGDDEDAFKPPPKKKNKNRLTEAQKKARAADKKAEQKEVAMVRSENAKRDKVTAVGRAAVLSPSILQAGKYSAKTYPPSADRGTVRKRKVKSKTKHFHKNERNIANGMTELSPPGEKDMPNEFCRIFKSIMSNGCHVDKILCTPVEGEGGV